MWARRVAISMFMWMKRPGWKILNAPNKIRVARTKPISTKQAALEIKKNIPTGNKKSVLDFTW